MQRVPSMTTLWALRAARPAFQRRNRKSPFTLAPASGTHGGTDIGSAHRSHQAHQHRNDSSGNWPLAHSQAQVRQLQRRLGAYWPCVNAHSSGAEKSGAESISHVAAPTADGASQAAKGPAATPEAPTRSTSMRNFTASSAAHALRCPSLAGVHCVQATPLCPLRPPGQSAATVRRPLPRSSGLCAHALRGKPHVPVLAVLVLVFRVLAMFLLFLRTTKMTALPFSTLLWRNGRTELEARLRAA